MKSNHSYLILAFLIIPILSGCAKGNTGLHPDFNISKQELTDVVRSLPDGIRNNILKKPQCFLEFMERILREDPAYTVLVDKSHSLTKTYIPKDLININDYGIPVTRKNLKLRSIVIPDLKAMEEAANLRGIKLTIGSSYRSYTYQNRLYSHYVKTEGREKADRESARPGHSQHQLGTTIDFYPIEDNFIETKQGTWLSENAWKYGFSLSYPPNAETITGYKYEPWHYRYVGRDVAYIIKRYFLDQQEIFLQFFNTHKKFFMERIIS
ncbi:MAG: M15 family metallopeptidase [Spirochaetales bacterium]|nr:M15 family metallopeptidase [Spirochaetales bacterium]